MKLRFSTSMLLAIVLFVNSTVTVNASPDQQISEDAIIQALNATAQELGLGAKAEITIEEGIKIWAVNPPIDVGTTSLLVSRSNMFESFLALASIFGGSALPVNFHGDCRENTYDSLTSKPNWHTYKDK